MQLCTLRTIYRHNGHAHALRHAHVGIAPAHRAAAPAPPASDPCAPPTDEGRADDTARLLIFTIFGHIEAPRADAVAHAWVESAHSGTIDP